MNKKEFSKMSLGLDLLNDLPNIEVINNADILPRLKLVGF